MSSFVDNSHDDIASINSSDIINNNTNEEENEIEPLGLLSISIDVMSIILTQCLTIYDIGNVDTAYCNKKKRIQLLSILSNNDYIQYNHLTFAQFI